MNGLVLLISVLTETRPSLTVFVPETPALF